MTKKKGINDATLICNRTHTAFLKSYPSLVIYILIDVCEYRSCSFKLNLKIQPRYSLELTQALLIYIKSINTFCLHLTYLHQNIGDHAELKQWIL